MSPLRRAVGLVLIMIGAVWFMLGSGMLGGSFMTGQTIWAIVGAMVAIVGLWVVTRRPSAPPAPSADDADAALEEPDQPDVPEDRDGPADKAARE
ncbi:MAG: hypothetical protein ACKOT0_12810 [bacterium]